MPTRRAPWGPGLLALTALLVAVACAPTAKRGEPFTDDPADRDATLARGRVVFMQQCHTCHPFGDGGLAPKLLDKPLPGSAIKLQTRLGVGAMPAFGKDVISDAQLDDLVAYIYALRDQRPDPATVAPPARR
jgi:mono/diheme cytochrome c family protein